MFKEDGKTPYRNCLVEIWQCDEKRIYDNTSELYKYRGTQKTGANGEYHFITTQPQPYKLSEQSERYRPAHIHMRLSGEGQQDLVTQIYFSGDPHIEKDGLAKLPQAQSRILTIKQNDKNEEVVHFDVVMAKEFVPSNSFFDKISGVYEMSNNQKSEYYRQGDLLFIKYDGQIMAAASYKGNNEFNIPVGGTCRFELLADGGVKVCQVVGKSTECTLTGIKIFKY